MKFDFMPIVKTLLWVLLFLLIAALLFAVGLMVGYGVLGEGEMMDIFQPETWQHILDYVQK